MTRRGSGAALDVEAAFICWYDNGRRRTYVEIARLFAVSESRLRRVACDYDWVGRADALDQRARRIVDERLTMLRAQATTQLVTIALAVMARYERRLLDAVEGPSGALIPNPYRLRPGELSMADVLQAVKLLNAVGVLGDGPGENGAEEQRRALAEVSDMVAEMYLWEELEQHADD